MGTIRYIAKQMKGGKLGSSVKNKFYGRPQLGIAITADQLNDLIAQDSQVERAEVAMVTDAIFKQIKELVCNGHSIQVGTLGTFSIGLKCDSKADVASLTANDIKKVNVRLYESKYVKTALKATRFIKAKVASDELPTP